MLLSQSATAGYRIPYSDVFATYAGSITSVITCGEWAKGDNDSGQFRVIALSVEAQTFLYVDKVRISHEQTRFEVVKGIAIEEFDDDHVEIELTDLACYATGSGIRISAKAISGHDDSVRRIRIDVNAADDSYSVHVL